MSNEEIEEMKKLLEDWEKMSVEWERVFLRDEIRGLHPQAPVYFPKLSL